MRWLPFGTGADFLEEVMLGLGVAGGCGWAEMRGKKISQKGLPGTNKGERKHEIQGKASPLGEV